MSSGLVGINTTSPANTLDVDGIINAGPSSGANLIWYDLFEQTFIHIYGKLNCTWLGFNAGNTINTNQGSANTGIGEGAINAIQGGNYNTAVGWNALTNTVNGSNNTAIGSSALPNGASDSNNTAVGYYALYNNTVNDNTAVGYQSLYTNSTGQDNVAIGYNALYYNTTNGTNVAVGNYALGSNTAGANTAVGYEACNDNTTGGNNTATGNESLHNNSTGNDNTGVGHSALYHATGNYNTGIGYNADVYTASLTDATAIGYEASVKDSYAVQLGENNFANPLDVSGGEGYIGTYGHIRSEIFAPGATTVAAGGFAGGGATASITNGTDVAGLVQINCGATPNPGVGSYIAVTFNTQYANASNVVLTPASCVPYPYDVSVTTTGFSINMCLTALAPHEIASWYYVVVETK